MAVTQVRYANGLIFNGTLCPKIVRFCGKLPIQKKYKSHFQVMDHPSVKMFSEDQERGRVEGSVGGRVPDKYMVVRNNELLHIRLVTC